MFMFRLLLMLRLRSALFLGHSCQCRDAEFTLLGLLDHPLRMPSSVAPVGVIVDQQYMFTRQLLGR